MATLVHKRTPAILGYLNPLRMVRHVWQHRELIRQFTIREIQGRYRGSFLGIFWSLARPLFLLSVYTFVFGIIFQSRWPQARSDSLAEFAIILFCGLIAFETFSESVNRAPGLIIGVPNYVKKVVFPLEILPISVLGAALFHLLINLTVLVATILLTGGSLYWTFMLLPLVMLPMIFITLGTMWLLASLGVFIRDIGQLLGLLIQAMFFFTPIFYTTETVPEPFRTLVLINPIAPVTENFRRVILWGTLPSMTGLFLWILLTGMVMLIGYAWFMHTRKAFADVV